MKRRLIFATGLILAVSALLWVFRSRSGHRQPHAGLELMPEFHDRFRLVLHAYVLMSNHFHLLVETPQPLLPAAMQWLQTSYSMWFNRKHERVGPLFQGRYKAVVVQPESWALAVSRYVHLNPIRIRS